MSKFVYIPALLLLSIPMWVSAAVTLDTVPTDGFDMSGTAPPGSTVTIVGRTSRATCQTTADTNGRYTCSSFDRSPQDGETLELQSIENGVRSPITEIGNGVQLTDASRERYNFQREGVFGCAAGAYAMPVGTLRAISGVYVPVNDAAVTLNTGYLVYKECVLDGVVRSTAESATAALSTGGLRWLNEGRNGNTQFISNQEAEKLALADKKYLEFLREYRTNALCEPFQQRGRVAVAKMYLTRRDPTAAFQCTAPVNGADLETCITVGDDLRTCGGLPGFIKLVRDSNNNPLFAALALDREAANQSVRRIQDVWDQLDWSGGILPLEEVVSTATETGEDHLEYRTLTPGFLIAAAMEQFTTSGFRQLESASEIDQIVGALFSGLTTQIVADARGLSGLTESKGGQAPYLNRLTAESSARVRTGATNAALSVLGSSLEAENQYNQVKKSTIQELERSIARLKAAEDACWNLLIPAVQAIARECVRTETSTNTQGEQVTTCVEYRTIPLAISTSTRRITEGVVALSVSASTTLQAGASLAFTVPQNTLMSSGSLGLTTASAGELGPGTNVGLPISGTVAPSPGGRATLSVGSFSFFSGGSLSFDLFQGASLPLGEVRFPVTAVYPYTIAVALSVEIARLYSDDVAQDSINPLLNTIRTDVRKSDEAIVLLQRLVNDVRNTSSQTVQRLALERLDTLISQGTVHTAYDVKSAQSQNESVKNAMEDLVKTTIEEWGTGSGWCNAENPTVVQMWLDRWRAD